MTKLFYCDKCEIYTQCAAATLLRGESIPVYNCTQCHTRIEIVDRPCDHKWRADHPHDPEWGLYAVRSCEKCGMQQRGTISVTWPDPDA